jgi:hypothetical protein
MLSTGVEPVQITARSGELLIARSLEELHREFRLLLYSIATDVPPGEFATDFCLACIAGTTEKADRLGCIRWRRVEVIVIGRPLAGHSITERTCLSEIVGSASVILLHAQSRIVVATKHVTCEEFSALTRRIGKTSRLPE